MNFICKNGDLETNIPWSYPNRERFDQWLLDFFPVIENSNFNFSLTGNFSEQIQGKGTVRTKDIDIVVSGVLDDVDYLKSIFKKAILLGWKNKINIDIFFSSTTYLDSKKFLPFYNIFYDNLYYCKYNEIEILRHRLHDTSNTYLFSNGLVGVLYLKPPKFYLKTKKRVENNVYTNSPINLKELIT